MFLAPLMLVYACAEIVPLTGGESDMYAPTVEQGTQHPAQEALNVNTQELTVKFNEYFTLNDPNNTVLMNPKAGEITTTSSKKELRIRWTDSLQPNTTYIIQLNGTIRDLNERNDTVHQFVFSTGNNIDSLKIGGIITDAFENTAAKACVLGLYSTASNPFVDQPIYVSQSNTKGEFEFSYLKPGSYQLFAFVDSNKDRKPSINEKIAFASTPIQAGDTNALTLKTFIPKDTTQVLKIKLIQPGLATLSGIEQLEHKVLLNGQAIDVLNQFASDSLQIALPMPDQDFFTFVTNGKDTLQKQFSSKERTQRFSLINTNYKATWRFTDTIQYECNELLKSVDTSLIQLTDVKKNKIPYQVQVEKNKLYIIPTQNSIYDLALKMNRGAIKGLYAENDSLSTQFTTKVVTDLSTLILDVSDFEGSWIVQLMDGPKFIQSAYKSNSDILVSWKNLLPGNYAVLCIEDLDLDKKWSRGDYSTKKQPERVVRFQLKSKLRPNWDIEEKLVLDE